MLAQCALAGDYRACQQACMTGPLAMEAPDIVAFYAAQADHHNLVHAATFMWGADPNFAFGGAVMYMNENTLDMLWEMVSRNRGHFNGKLDIDKILKLALKTEDPEARSYLERHIDHIGI